MQMPAVCSPKALDRNNLATLSYPRLIAVATSPAAARAQMGASQDDLKRIAAHRAVELVRSGMVLGLGTGSTAIHALERIACLLNSGELTDVVGIPTSKKTEGEARALGIPLGDLESNPNIDLSIDGADEVDPFLNLVKGRGGSLLREKMVEGASKRFVVIADESKWVDKLGGSKMAVPVEVIPFGWKYTLTRLKKVFEGKAGFDARLRMKGEEIFTTDNLNYIIELFFENGIDGDLDEISNEILRIVGVVEHGMFLGMATEVIIAGKDGVVVKTRAEVGAAAAAEQMRTMSRRRSANDTGASGSDPPPSHPPLPPPPLLQPDGPTAEVPREVPTDVFEVFRGMLEAQQQQTTLLRESFLAAQQTATTALQVAAALREARSGTITDFRRLQPAVFSGAGSPLEAEQWLVDMANLLKAAKIPEADQVEVVKIQLADVARSWWLAEEQRHPEAFTWQEFSVGFLARFFPKTAKREMEERFIQLQQGDMTVDEYAAEFVRLSRFAPGMVANEEDKANRFQQGLRIELQRMIASTEMVTYDQVLSAARRSARVECRDSQSRVPAGQRLPPPPRPAVPAAGSSGQQKRQFSQISAAGPGQQASAVQIICSYCHRPGHIRRDCRRALGTCLGCESPEHRLSQCPHRQGQMVQRPVLPAPPRPAAPAGQRPAVLGQMRPPVPYQYRLQFQQQQQQQRAPAVGAAYPLAAEQAEVPCQIAADPGSEVKVESEIELGAGQSFHQDQTGSQTFYYPQ